MGNSRKTTTSTQPIIHLHFREGGKMFPVLTFFCELEAQPLEALFTNPQVIPDLKGLNAGVSLGILDLSPERAGVVSSEQSQHPVVTARWPRIKVIGSIAPMPPSARRYAEF
jgi:hypothetical protein